MFKSILNSSNNRKKKKYQMKEEIFQNNVILIKHNVPDYHKLTSFQLSILAEQ